jgi:hypothetical protein
MSTPLNLFVKAVIKGRGLAKRPGVTRDGRLVLSLLVSIDGIDYELNLVTKPGEDPRQFAEYLVRNGIVAKDDNEFTILVPTWSLAKAKNNTIWVHVEDYERLKDTTT